MGHYFEDLAVGMRFQTRGRTITEADLVNLKPVFIGDTVSVTAEVKELCEPSSADRGVIVQRVLVTNQRDELVQEGELVSLIRRRGR